MKRRVAICIAVAVTLFSISCGHEPDDTNYIPATDYYPLRLGNYIIYDVDSIRYHETIPTDSSHYEVKEILADTFYDNEGRLNYSIERYIKADSGDFVLQNVWSVLDANGNIEKVENNLRFIKLTAGILQGEQWDGHIYLGGLDDIPVEEQCNNLSFLEDWQFEYSLVDEPFDVNGFNFEHTVTVEQSGSINLIEYNYAKEVFAKDVGLIYKEFFHYTDDDVDCLDCTWLEHVECGYSVVMRVKEF